MDQQKCKERSCLFPVGAGQEMCRYHLAMFAAEKSPSALSVEATDEDVFSAVFFDKSISIERRGMVSTEEWLEEKRWIEMQKKLYAANHRRCRIESGKCPHCNAAVRSGRTICDGCLEKGTARRHDLISKGMCVVCGAKQSANGTTRCIDCTEKRRSYQAAYAHAKFERRKTARLCTVCGNPNDTATTACSACKPAQSERGAKRYLALRQKETCVCGAARSLPSKEGLTAPDAPSRINKKP